MKSLPDLIATLQMLGEVAATEQSRAQKAKPAARYMQEGRPVPVAARPVSTWIGKAGSCTAATKHMVFHRVRTVNIYKPWQRLLVQS